MFGHAREDGHPFFLNSKWIPACAGIDVKNRA